MRAALRKMGNSSGVIMSPSELHDHLRTAVAAPMATGSRPAGFHVAVRFQGKDGLILLDQLRALDKSRLVRRLGALPPSVLRATLGVLRDMFAE